MLRAMTDNTFSSERTHALRLDQASPAWGLIMQAGVGLDCTIGVPLSTLLQNELGLSPEQIGRLDVTLLDGQPVDDRNKALVENGSRLALAAGLPGIAGLAMKSGSAVRALRGGITHRATAATGAAGIPPSPRPGRITLALFSLALSMLAAHFLARGVLASPMQIIRYAALSPNDPCSLNDEDLVARDLTARLAAWPKNAELSLTAVLRA